MKKESERVCLTPVDQDAHVYLVGLGMYELRQVTLETLEILKRAKRVFHLSGRHKELTALNGKTEDLSTLYLRPGKATEIYANIAKYVLSFAAETHPLVFAVEGNPMLFSDISWKIAELGIAANLRVEALPGVSCLDVLPIQLGFEPGDLGLQVLEATQLVLYSLSINPYLSTLILQVGELGKRELIAGGKRHPHIFGRFVSHLRNFFPSDHPAIFVVSASGKQSPSVVFSTEIDSIAEHQDRIIPGMTLYVPRIGLPSVDYQLGYELGLKEE